MNVKVILLNAFHPDVRIYKEMLYVTNKGYKAEILALDRANEHIDNKVQYFDGIKVTHFFPRGKRDVSKYKNFFKKIIYFFWFLRYVFQVKKHLKKEKFEILHCSGFYATLVGYLLKKKNTKLVYDMREYYEGQGRTKVSFIIKKLNKFLCNKVNHIIYVNDLQKKNITNKDKLVFLPNYVEAKFYQDFEKSKSDKLRISYIGNIRDVKSLKNLLDSCKDNKDIIIGLNGRGSAYKEFKKISGNYDNLLLTGAYDGVKEIAQLFKKCDILFCGYDPDVINWRHAIATKFFEAIVTLTPVIVFDDTLMGEMVKKHDIGFIVKDNTVASFKKTISKISKKHLIKKIDNLKKIQYDYTWEKVVKNLDKIY